MKPTRSFILTLAALSLAVTAFAQSSKPASHQFLAYVGTYTTKTDSKGIYALDFESETGKLTLRGVAAETPDPSWLALHPSGKYVYVANEAGKQSTISAFSLDAQTGKLALLNKLPARGEDPCHLSFDKSGKYLFVANYSSGNVVVFPILSNGKLGKSTSALKDQGTLGPNTERQKAPHAHWIAISGTNRGAFVADLGLDRVLFYDFNASKGTLALHNATVSPKRPFAQNSLELKPASGPRHAAVGKFPDYRQFIYVLGELDSTITAFATSKEGIFGLVQRVSTLPSGFSSRNDAAEIAIHPDGKWLFASNRGHDSIAVFQIDPSTGFLTPSGHFPTGGKEPRHFALDPTGRFLLAENQNSNNIVVFRIDLATGALQEVSRLDNLPSPVNLVFLPSPLH